MSYKIKHIFFRYNISFEYPFKWNEWCVNIYIVTYIIPNMDTNKSKVSVSVYMLSNSRAEFVLVSSIVMMHWSILNKNIFRASGNWPYSYLNIWSPILRKRSFLKGRTLRCLNKIFVWEQYDEKVIILTIFCVF